MKKNVLSIVLSTIFRLIMIFLLMYLWVGYYLRIKWLAILVSAILTLSIDWLIYFIGNKKNYKLNLKEKESQKIDDCANAFIFNEDGYSVNFFYELALSRHNAKKTTKFVVILNANSRIVLFPYFSIRSFSADDFIYVYNKAMSVNPTKIIICTNNFDNEAETLAGKMATKSIILNKTQTYFGLLKEYDVYPKNTINFYTKEKTTFKEFFTSVFERKKTKAYFLSSLALLASSFIVRYNLYFLIMSSLLLIMSIISFISPRFIKMPEKKLLDN